MTTFVFTNTERPKRLARELIAELQAIGHPLQMAKALEVVAWMYGYSTWNVLVAMAGATAASDDDDQWLPEVIACRRKTHEEALIRLGADRTAGC